VLSAVFQTITITRPAFTGFPLQSGLARAGGCFSNETVLRANKRLTPCRFAAMPAPIKICNGLGQTTHSPHFFGRPILEGRKLPFSLPFVAKYNRQPIGEKKLNIFRKNQTGRIGQAGSENNPLSHSP
jgi:hypothetical protein